MLTLRQLSRNEANPPIERSSATLAGSSGDAGGDFGVGELHGTISNTRFTGNTVSGTSAAEELPVATSTGFASPRS
jgi:hypothetical protein